MKTAENRPPSCYAEWLECFEYLCGHNADDEYIGLLKKGTCSDAGVSVEYLEKQLIRTLNIMLTKYITDFNKTLVLYTDFGEYDRLYEPFRTLARQAEKCLFFTELDFMSEEFRRSLRDSVIANTRDHWKRSADSIRNASLEGNSSVLEDQLYMIRRIKLFGEYEVRRYEQLS